VKRTPNRGRIYGRRFIPPVKTVGEICRSLFIVFHSTQRRFTGARGRKGRVPAPGDNHFGAAAFDISPRQLSGAQPGFKLWGPKQNGRGKYGFFRFCFPTMSTSDGALFGNVWGGPRALVLPTFTACGRGPGDPPAPTRLSRNSQEIPGAGGLFGDHAPA